MVKYIIYIGIIFIFFSCEKEDVTPELNLKNCKVEYLNFMDDRRFIDNAYEIMDDSMYFEYTNNNIVKTVGGFQLFPKGTNLLFRAFTNDVTDSVVYKGNQIFVYTKPAYPYFLSDKPDNPTIYSLNDNDKLGKITRRDGVAFNYTYEDNLIIEKNSNDLVLRTFIMANNNLNKVLKEYYDSDGKMYYKKEILFQDYDNNPNPFKNRYYLLGAFYRAFSENNFSKYTINEYGYLNDGSFGQNSSFTFTMPIKYNKYNLPIFGDYE